MSEFAQIVSLPIPVSSVYSAPTSISIPNPLPVSSVYNAPINIPQPLQVSGIVAVIQDSTPWAVSGITPQLVTQTNNPTSISISNTPLPVSGVYLPTLSVSQTNVPTFINISGVVSVTPLPINVSGAIYNIPQLPASLGSQTSANSLCVTVPSTLNLRVSGVSQSQIGLADNTGNAFQAYTGGSAAPANGVWTFVSTSLNPSGIIVTPAGSTGVAVNPGIYPIISGAFVAYTSRYPVIQGTTYNVSGVVKSGWIGPS